MKKYFYLLLASFLITNLANAQIDRSKQPKPGPAPTVQLTSPSTIHLDNGLKVLIVENHKLPTVRMQLLIDNPLHTSGEKAGVGSLFASMLSNGTTTISKSDFNEEIDYMGATIFFSSEGGYVQTLSEFFPRTVELMADAIKNPLFDAGEFEKEKDKMIENLKGNEKNVSSVAARVRSALMFGKNHPKGEFTTIEKVENISLNDVKSYYNNYYNPNHAYLAIIGDVKKADIEDLIRKNFGDWKIKSVPSFNYTDPADVQYTQINFVDMPNAVQSEIAIGNLVRLKMSDPDYFPVLMANQILGGDFNGLLNMNLREANGWTYGAYSMTGADKNITRFMAMTSVRNAVTDSAVVEMLKEISYIRDNKVTAEQLNTAKAKFTGDFVRAMERPETISRYALTIETQDLSKDFYADYLKQINAVTAEDVHRVANKYYRPENLRIVIVGKGSEILDRIKAIKGPSGKQIPVFYYDTYAGQSEEPNYRQSLPEGVTVQTVFNNYLKAIGGKKAAEKVKTVSLKAKAEMQGMMLDLEMKNTSKNQSLMAISMGGMPIQKTVFNGKTGYNMVQGQRVDFDEEENAQAKTQAVPFQELKPGNAKLVRIESVDGKDAYVVSFGDDSESFYDVASGLKVKSENTIEAMGQTIVSTTTFENYKEVKGVKFPFTISQAAGPQEIKFEVSEIKVNEGVSDSDFE